MMIALDFDETYTLCPDVWDRCIDVFKESGHSVVVVTARSDRQDSLSTSDNSDVIDLCNRKNIQVIFCNHKPKRAFCQSLGFNFSVWIDDSPESIV